MSRRIQRLIQSHMYLAFILPPSVFVLSLTAYPALYSIFLSFTNVNLGIEKWSFVGLSNYLEVFTIPYLPMVLGNTAFFVVFTCALQLILGLLFALVLNQAWPFRSLVRGVAILPFIIPSVVIALLFRQIFDGSRLGIANFLLSNIGVPNHAWLAQPDTALPIMVAAAVWRGLPLTTILILGGLQTIERELYEAARIDGGTRTQVFMNITLPLLKPILLVSLILITAHNINAVDVPFGLTAGEPAHKTEVIAITLYDQAFIHLRAGFAASISTLMLIVNAGLAVVYLIILGGRLR